MKRNCIIAFFHFCLETCPVKSPFSNLCGRAQSLLGKSRYYGSWASLKLELKILFLFLWSASSWSLVLEMKRVVVAHPPFSFSYFFSFSGLGRMVGKIKKTNYFPLVDVVIFLWPSMPLWVATNLVSAFCFEGT